MALSNPNKVVTEERLHEFYGEILPYLGGMPEAVLVNGDLPIGTIVYRDGLTIPDGWLLCDGSTKNISTYPALANYFRTEHGKKNYYGGNGTSTFGLPSIRRMPGNASDEYTVDVSEEHIIGSLRNGKPIYQKTIETQLNSDTSIKTISLGFNVDYLVIKNAFCVVNGSRTPIPSIMPADFAIGVTINAFSKDNSGSPNAIKIATRMASFYGAWTYVTIQYDKTSDSMVPAGYSPDRKGIWIIKAKSTAADDYSTTEKIVGTWIDGKYIYQKTFTGTMPSTENTALSIPIGASVSNVFVKNAMYKNANNVWFPFPSIRQDTYAGDSAIRIASSTATSGANTIFLKCAVANAAYVITIQYTKTS